jgi:hypothetical protein
MSETKFGAWTAPEGNLVGIEYSLVVIEEIRQAVTEGFQRFARGGIEVGGVLYGTYDGKTARILAVRDIACEHAHGPSFVFSDKDRAALTGQLETDRADARLEGFQPLGFYVSHTRSEILLQRGDQEIYEAFFPEMWQVALVVRPGRAGLMRAGFFVREADGTVKTDQSYLDFNFPERSAMAYPSLDRAGDRAMDRAPIERRSYAGERPAAERPGRGIPPLEGDAQAEPPAAAPLPPRSIQFPPSDATDAAPPAAPEPIRAPEFALYPETKIHWKRWAMGVGVVIAAALVVLAGLRFYGNVPQGLFGGSSAAEPMSLAVFERQDNDHEGQLRIEWNHNAGPIRGASAGALQITDGKDVRSVTLAKEDLQRGSFTYARHAGEVQVQLEVQNPGGQKTREASRFLGGSPRATADANEADTVQLERDALKDEVTRLRTENAAQLQRNQQLERTLTILRLRLGIASPAPAPAPAPAPR